ncbi:MAG TPA: hypothetical protein DCL77_02515 [Prolixibacteraceae bacterium]|jgi:uncharacterized repeat protein (TIGR02059 family)|nr:hypothetical protein [Prolixibacteraceae bacterium]
MKRIKLLTLALFLVFFVNFAHCDTIKPDNAFIEYTGRIDFSNPLKPRFSYSGVSIRACFQGTSVSVILDDVGTQNYYNVILDNEVISRLQTKTGLNTYSLATGLKDTNHEIEIFKLTEESFGKTYFCGFVLGTGKTIVDIPNKREHLIEFIGNSITCGYGNEGVNGGKFGPTTQNHYLTYAAITSRSFNARHLAVCKSGIGIYRNYDGPVSGSADCMPNYYQRIFLYDAAPLYKFTDRPDLICIDLGTNDFSTSKGDPTLFVNNYLKFIDQLQLKNNGADILCLLGPMMGGNDLITIRNCLKSIVLTANAKNQGKVSFFEMSAQTGSLGIGIDYHPTVAQHLKNAKELINYISILKGWTVTPRAMIGSTSTGSEIVMEFNTEMHDDLGSFKGFSVVNDTTSIPVSGVSLDTDKTKIHLLLSSSLAPTQKVTVSYSPGSVKGKNDVTLDSISSMIISNILTVTSLASAALDPTGSKITLVFNKLMNKPLNLNGVKILDSSNNPLAVEQFTLASKNIDITLKDRVKAGEAVSITISFGIYSTDKVAVTPVDKYVVKNNSTYTSINEHQADQLVIYPNSLHPGMFNYRINGSTQGQMVSYLYNLKGQLVISKALKSTAGILDFSNPVLKGGYYILKIKTSQKEYSKKIML